MTSSSAARRKPRIIRRVRRKCYCREMDSIGYRDVSYLRNYVSDRAKMEAGRRVGSHAKCHRRLRIAVLRARFMALLPYSPDHERDTRSLLPAETSESTIDREDNKHRSGVASRRVATETSESTIDRGDSKHRSEVASRKVATETTGEGRVPSGNGDSSPKTSEENSPPGSESSV